MYNVPECNAYMYQSVRMCVCSFRSQQCLEWVKEQEIEENDEHGGGVYVSVNTHTNTHAYMHTYIHTL